ncbi:hypothetical protein LR48_Vigan09g203100 [Vigna angularis]|uniref:Uncharacterized protein n=1 Tax=Phaseolus angularis TaxID=3914 RepID=A0A0L9VEK7_PHAAN|nr:hypothetical protein LR48_Vigan09g203100 [Vigna angularis]
MSQICNSPRLISVILEGTEEVERAVIEGVEEEAVKEDANEVSGEEARLSPFTHVDVTVLDEENEVEQ